MSYWEDALRGEAETRSTNGSLPGATTPDRDAALDRVLAPGGSRDAADLVEDFLGRPYTFDAYAAWLRR